MNLPDGRRRETFYRLHRAGFEDDGTFVVDTSAYVFFPDAPFSDSTHLSGRKRVPPDDSDYPFWVWVVLVRRPTGQVSDETLAPLRHEFYCDPLTPEAAVKRVRRLTDDVTVWRQAPGSRDLFDLFWYYPDLRAARAVATRASRLRRRVEVTFRFEGWPRSSGPEDPKVSARFTLRWDGVRSAEALPLGSVDPEFTFARAEGGLIVSTLTLPELDHDARLIAGSVSVRAVVSSTPPE